MPVRNAKIMPTGRADAGCDRWPGGCPTVGLDGVGRGAIGAAAPTAARRGNGRKTAGSPGEINAANSNLASGAIRC
jgi:hypothetical protein